VAAVRQATAIIGMQISLLFDLAAVSVFVSASSRRFHKYQ
jgi:hypothetical protein